MSGSDHYSLVVTGLGALLGAQMGATAARLLAWLRAARWPLLLTLYALLAGALAGAVTAWYVWLLLWGPYAW